MNTFLIIYAVVITILFVVDILCSMVADKRLKQAKTAYELCVKSFDDFRKNCVDELERIENGEKASEEEFSESIQEVVTWMDRDISMVHEYPTFHLAEVMNDVFILYRVLANAGLERTLSDHFDTRERIERIREEFGKIDPDIYPEESIKYGIARHLCDAVCLMLEEDERYVL